MISFFAYAVQYVFIAREGKALKVSFAKYQQLNFNLFSFFWLKLIAEDGHIYLNRVQKYTPLSVKLCKSQGNVWDVGIFFQK